MVDLKAELLKGLQGGRAAMLAKLEGLPEYERRPSTPTGTTCSASSSIWPAWSTAISVRRSAAHPVSARRGGATTRTPRSTCGPRPTNRATTYGVYRQAGAIPTSRHRAHPGRPRPRGPLARRPPGNDPRGPADQDGCRDRTACRSRRHHPRTARRPHRRRSGNHRLSVLAQQKNHHPRSRQPLPPTARKPVAPSRTRLLASRP